MFKCKTPDNVVKLVQEKKMVFVLKNKTVFTEPELKKTVQKSDYQIRYSDITRPCAIDHFFKDVKSRLDFSRITLNVRYIKRELGKTIRGIGEHRFKEYVELCLS